MNDQAIQLADPRQHTPLSIAEIKDQVQVIQKVMRDVMKPDVHFGKIPGAGDKPTLLKPGSEKLLSTFRIAVDPIVEDLSTEDEIRYRVTCKGVHMGTGIVVGAGVGECSTAEEKYRWRAAVCDEEWDDTPEGKRRTKYKSQWGQAQGERVTTKVKQVATDPADKANTVLKMAKKRAEADLCLTALAASDIFAQDLEDGPRPEAPQTANPRAGSSMPQAASEAPQSTAPASTGGRGFATEKQVGMLRARMFDASLAETHLLAAFEIGSMEEMPFDQVNNALEWIASMGQGQR